MLVRGPYNALSFLLPHEGKERTAMLSSCVFLLAHVCSDFVSSPEAVVSDKETLRRTCRWIVDNPAEELEWLVDSLLLHAVFKHNMGLTDHVALEELMAASASFAPTTHRMFLWKTVLGSPAAVAAFEAILDKGKGKDASEALVLLWMSNQNKWFRVDVDVPLMARRASRRFGEGVVLSALLELTAMGEEKREEIARDLDRYHWGRKWSGWIRLSPLKQAIIAVFLLACLLLAAWALWLTWRFLF
jgi:uncharacterized protein with PIN domain